MGTETSTNLFKKGLYDSREDGSPSWGRKPTTANLCAISTTGREDGSPSWGRKLIQGSTVNDCFIVEKMGPLRGDGNAIVVFISITPFFVEKMGPLRGDGNFFFLLISQL